MNAKHETDREKDYRRLLSAYDASTEEKPESIYDLINKALMDVKSTNDRANILEKEVLSVRMTEQDENECPVCDGRGEIDAPCGRCSGMCGSEPCIFCNETGRIDIITGARKKTDSTGSLKRRRFLIEKL